MTFGRPPMTSTIPDVRSATSFLRFHDNDDFECSTEDDDVCFFVETFRLSQILEAILRTIYQPGETSISETSATVWLDAAMGIMADLIRPSNWTRTSLALNNLFRTS